MKQCIFLGDSLIEFGDWNTLLPEFRIENRGRAGETVEELATRLGGEIETAGEADHLLLMSGTNNLLMGDEHFPAIFESMLRIIPVLLPDTTVTVTSLLPMSADWLAAGDVIRINAALGAVAAKNNSHFLDIHGLFQRRCKGDDCFTMDGVHLSDSGYRIWADGLRSHFKRLERLLTP